ncbi:energy-coupling factor transporter transmembrane component T family protein [Pontibacillus salicampi]|uniref:Energy-coupling factor transporter transmembrane component T family protein n=1 Tax=Pontibacillus salicampi TaxID=1449801 RepID=A0ABV6LRL0_9BACI
MSTLLHQINPSLKAITVVLTVCLLAFVFDPFTPLLYCIFTILLTILFGKVAWSRYALFFLPFFIISLGMLWTTIAFADEPTNKNDVVALLWWNVPREDVMVALSLSLRMLAFASLSLMFVFTTNMVHFILSLMQQCKLPPKLAYGILAGYRFLPMMKEELAQIRAAHRVRGVNRATNIKESLQQYKRFAIPLLAGAIRKAERTAIAMESKGFTGDKKRTWYRRFTLDWRDWAFLAFMITIFFLIAYSSYQLGYFRWYQGQF